MEKDEIRFRYKKTGKIYSVPVRFLNKDGSLHFTPPDEMGGVTLPRTYIRRDEYEIIPQEDFFEFRRNTARQILCTLLEKGENDYDYLTAKAVEITDKLIEKL